MIVTFEKSGQTEIMEDLLSMFRFGLHGERKFNGFQGGSALAYVRILVLDVAFQANWREASCHGALAIYSPQPGLR